jgi:hypothetical protein
MFRASTKPKSNRIAVLQKEIKWIEEHYHHYHHCRHRGNLGNNNDGVVKQLKQELGYFYMHKCFFVGLFSNSLFWSKVCVWERYKRS